MKTDDWLFLGIAIITVIVMIAVVIDMKRCSEKGGSYIQYQCLKVEKL